MRKIFTVTAMAVALALSTFSTAVAETVATGTLNVTNNGSYERNYNDVQYSCGTGDVVVYTATEQAGLNEGSNDDGDRHSTISGTIDTATGEMTWTFVRGTYTASLSGEGAYDDGTFTWVQVGDATSGVFDAAGTFTNVPSCAVVPAKPADVCKDGGYLTVDGGYKNQGQCVSHYARSK